MDILLPKQMKCGRWECAEKRCGPGRWYFDSISDAMRFRVFVSQWPSPTSLTRLARRIRINKRIAFDYRPDDLVEFLTGCLSVRPAGNRGARCAILARYLMGDSSLGHREAVDMLRFWAENHPVYWGHVNGKEIFHPYEWRKGMTGSTALAIHSHLLTAADNIHGGLIAHSDVN